MEYDGSVKLGVEVDDKGAQRQLNALTRRINSLEEKISQGTARRNGIAESLRVAQQEAISALNEVERLEKALKASRAYTSSENLQRTDPLTFQAELEKQDRITAELEQQRKLLAEKEKEAEKLAAQDEKLSLELERQTAELERQKSTAAELYEQITAGGTKGLHNLRSGAESVTESFNKGLKSMLKYGLGIRSMYVLFNKLRSYITEGIKEFAAYDDETRNSINNLKTALSGLKGGLATAFAPIFNAVAPALQYLIDLLTQAASSVAAFFAVLGGKTTYKKAVAGISSAAGAIGSAGSAAKEADKYLSSLDELKTWDEGSSGGSGGGGGGGTSGGGLSWVDEAIDMESFAAKLALTFDDVILDWTDLTGEQIAEKIVAGFVGLMGAVAGFALTGSLAGGLVGAILGVALGLVVDTMIFDNDGKISETEVYRMIALALTALTGGIIGFAVGNFAGAAIGATIGVGIFAAISAVFGNGGMLSKDQALRYIATVLTVFAGGVIGFVVGGPGGALLGAALGLGLSLLLKGASVKGDGTLNTNAFLNATCTAMLAMLGGLVGFITAGPAGALLGVVIGLSIGFSIQQVSLIGNAYDSFVEDANKKMEGVQNSVDSWFRDGWLGNKFREWFEPEGFEVSVEANITGAKDNIPESDKTISGARAGISAINDNVKKGKKTIGGVVAETVSLSDNIQERELTGFTAGLNDKTDRITNKKLTGFNAGLNAKTDSIADKMLRGFDAGLSTKTDKIVDKKLLGFNAGLSTKTDGISDKRLSGFNAVLSTKTDSITNKSLTGFNSGLTSWTDSLKNKVINFTSLLNYWERSSQWINGGASWNSIPFTAKLTSIDKSAIGTPTVNVSGKMIAVTKAGGGVYANGGWKPIQQFASGGYPRAAQLFMAREAGPELVGTLGGHTAVMNNDQIVASVSAGVARAISSLKFYATGSYDAILSGIGAIMSAARERLINIDANVAGIRTEFPAVTPDMIPAVLRGQEVPPQLLGIREDLGDIKTALGRLADLLSGGGSGGGGDISVSAKVHERTLFDVVIEQARIRQAQTGVNPFGLA